MTYWSGIVNETDLCYLEGTPHGLLDVLGLRSKEIDGLYEWEENLLIPVTENSLQLNTSYKCKKSLRFNSTRRCHTTHELRKGFLSRHTCTDSKSVW